MNRSILTLVVGLAALAPVVLQPFVRADGATLDNDATTSRAQRVPPTRPSVATYTHFVRSDGSTTSFCAEREPCSLSRAVSLIGSSNMRPGSAVLVQFGSDGVYSQAALTFAGSGTAQEPIRFVGENGVRLTGTRFKPEPSRWTRVQGRQFTYQLDWDEQTAFPVDNAAQRPPVKTWRPIRVDDRRPPFTQSMGRPFSLEFPIRYTARSSIAQVEAQHCTIWNDRSNNKVYVHMCHDGPPADADNLYLGSSGWGSVVINGDYLWLENLAIEQTTGTGLKVNPSANGTVLKRIAARASQVWLEGTNTLAEVLDVGHFITQGLHPTECYDANPDFGVGASAGNRRRRGTALLIGRDKSQLRPAGRWCVGRKSIAPGTAAVWTGSQTLEDSEILGIPEPYVGRRVARVCHQPQCVPERAGLDLSRGTTVRQSHRRAQRVRRRRPFLGESRRAMVAPAPSGWRFRHNILKDPRVRRQDLPLGDRRLQSLDSVGREHQDDESDRHRRSQ